MIESKTKPSQPWGEIAQSAFGEVSPASNQGEIVQSILAIGRQDTDPDGLTPPPGITILGASSDHLVVDSTPYAAPLSVGSELSFQLNYSALLRAMTSPFISKVMSPLTTTLRAESAQNGLRSSRINVDKRLYVKVPMSKKAYYMKMNRMSMAQKKVQARRD